MRTRVTIILVSLLALAFQMGGSKAPMNDTIRQDSLRADLFFLASDEMKGRLSDTPENGLAAEFIKSRFERMGLKPVGPGNSFFQPYNLLTASLGQENMLVVVEGENSQQRLRPGQDYYPLNFSGSGRVRSQLAFAGFGMVSPRLNHDDYKGAVLRGKIALILDHEPGENDAASPFDGLVTTEAAAQWRKALAAQEKGAIGVLFVSDVHNHAGPGNFEGTARNYWPPQDPRIRRFTLATWVDRIRIPAAQISPALAASLLKGSGKTLEEMSKSAEVAGGYTPVAIQGPQIELTASVTRRNIPDRNVVGAIEGSDPQLKNEVVIVCAHYDHDGADGPRIFNGADDDGSGTVALINIAEAYATAARAGQRPRRTVLFAAWNSEERGLLGAWAYTENPIWPLDKTAGVLNMDMIGRNEEVPVGGGARFRGLEVQTAESNNNAINIMAYSRSADMKTAAEKANGGIGLELKMRYDNNSSNLLRRSDQWPFLQRGVPAMFFHTGLHPDYHTVYDRPEKINYVKMEKIARLVHQMSWDLATQDARPELSVR